MSNVRSGAFKALIDRMVFFIVLACLFPVLPVSAHDARPVVVTLTEQFPGVYQFVIRAPETVESGNFPSLVLPMDCEAQNINPGRESSSGTVVCESALNGKMLSLGYPFYNPSLAAFYRLTTQEGETMTAMLSPTQDVWEIPEEPSAGNVAMEYLTLGVGHILGGLDHLLFVLGLLVVAQTTRRILLTITGFTVAHSITLSLSSLGLVTIPIVPVEAVIALSIVFLAFEISRNNHDTITYRWPLIVSFGFGLLHGLGFASALGEIGLVQSEILVSLLFFNLGVEAGQLLFILLVSGGIWCLSQMSRVFMKKSVMSPFLTTQRMDFFAAYLIGIPASYWLIDRIVQFMT